MEAVTGAQGLVHSSEIKLIYMNVYVYILITKTTNHTKFYSVTRFIDPTFYSFIDYFMFLVYIAVLFK